MSIFLSPFLPAGAYNHVYTVWLIIYSYEAQSLTMCPRDEGVPAFDPPYNYSFVTHNWDTYA